MEHLNDNAEDRVDERPAEEPAPVIDDKPVGEPAGQPGGEQSAQPSGQPEPEGGFVMPEGAVSAEDVVGVDFWEGLTLPDMKPKKRSVKSRIAAVVLSLVFVAAGFGIACVTARGRGTIANLVRGDKHMTFSLPMHDKPTTDRDLTDSTGRYTAEGIAEVCGPSVVSLDIYGEASAIIPVGQGSGIIISSEGYIVSNAHVVDKATRAIKVVLSDGREYAAEVIGSDPATDIAVIRIPGTDLTPAEFGKSDQIALGEDVVVIGCPAGYRNSVTKGVVSGLDRKIKAENSLALVSCIQIDAAVNPGNSGGALFNMWGQVVGITSSKLASVDYEGIGFAISSNEAKTVIEGIIEGSSALERVRIGITFTPVTTATAEMSDTKPGIYVVTIDPSCDVANTELRSGDIITEIDGVSTVDNDDVPSIVQGRAPGDEVTCHVYRPATEDEKEKEFDITFKLMSDKGSLVESE